MITRRITVEPETVIHMKLRNHLVNLKFQLPNSKSKIPLVPQWILSTQILKNWHSSTSVADSGKEDFIFG